MGASLHVEGYAEPDEKWKKMKAIWDACVSAEIKIPFEVEKYFGGRPSDAGQPVKLRIGSVDSEYEDILELLVKDIPEHVKIIRFRVSY